MKITYKKGRPTAYQTEYAEQAYKLCLLGATDEQLADFFDVSRASIGKWKRAQPLFLDAMRRGKLTADFTIAESLFKSAQGYEVTETTESTVDGQVKCITTRKKYPPNVTAAIFWLKNRQKQTWNEHFKPAQASRQEDDVFDDMIKPMPWLFRREPDEEEDGQKPVGFGEAGEGGHIATDAVMTPAAPVGQEEEVID